MAAEGSGEMVFDEKSERLWPDPDAGPFRITLYWVRDNGRPRLVGGGLLPMDRSAAEEVTLTTLGWRNVKLAEISAELREQLEYIEPAKPAAEVVLAGMRPATVKRLRRVAEVYQAAWRAGESPTQAVARALTISSGAAGNLVKRARDAGLLPPTQAGIPHG